jgi:hypothetical protein
VPPTISETSWRRTALLSPARWLTPALKDLELLPQDESEAQGFPGPRIKYATNYLL